LADCRQISNPQLIFFPGTNKVTSTKSLYVERTK
jgi:hypothetical protein